MSSRNIKRLRRQREKSVQRRAKLAKRKGRQGGSVVLRKPFDWREFGGKILRGIRFLLVLSLLGAIFVGPYYAWRYLQKTDILFKINRVSVYGDIHYIPQERINELTETALDQNLIGLDMREYQRNILSEPWIRSVKLRRKWFEELEVVLVEERPVAIWNKTQLIDKKAHTFVPNEIPKRDWIELEGPEDEKRLMLDRLGEILPTLRRAEIPLKRLALDDRHSWSLELKNGVLVILGSEDFKVRFQRFINHFQEPDLLERVTSIDFRYKNGFSVKWKDGASLDKE